jgi:hypothetical protein
MYQFLDEMDMWSAVGKNPEKTSVLNKHVTKVSLGAKNCTY